LHVGLDIYQSKTAIFVVSDKENTVVEGNALALPTDIHHWLETKQVDLAAIKGVCLEAGALSSFVNKGLEQLGLPVVCVETYQAHQFLKSQRNKTDKNDARGLARAVQR